MKQKYLSANALKIIACVAMAIDHMGYMIFPSQKIFRIIGRISYPIFAYFLAKGCYYTKNRLKRFLTLLIFAVVCQTGFYLFTKETKMSILVTFCISELLIYFLCYFKESLASDKVLTCYLSTFFFGLGIIFTILFCFKVHVDYGFWGCIAPVLTAIPMKKQKTIGIAETLFLCLGIYLLQFSNTLGYINYFSYLAIPFLLVYNGERGKYNIKYFFYFFYPLHLCVLQGIAYLIR